MDTALPDAALTFTLKKSILTMMQDMIVAVEFTDWNGSLTLTET